MQKILLVEDSPEFQLSVMETLGQRYEVTVAGDCATAAAYLAASAFDLVILDVTLPDQDGFSFFQETQEKSPFDRAPVVFLTGRDSLEDRVRGLQLGAEDYLLKPFEPAEFIARIENRISRPRPSQSHSEALCYGPFTFNLAQQRVTMKEAQTVQALALTPVEFRMLVYFANHPGQNIARSQLADATLGVGIFVLERTIDKHICSLRRKLGSYSQSIQTVFGEGYRFSIS